jgi:type IV secretory pathway protease TraF
MEVVALAVSSLACLVAAVLMLVVRGTANWSRGFAVTWYGLFGGSVVLPSLPSHLQHFHAALRRSED